MEEVQSLAPDQSLRKKLDKMFSRYDYVGVSNPLKKQFVWAVALEQNEILGVSPADGMNEAQMARQSGGTFLPGDSLERNKTKITRVVLEPGERRMIVGEAAYVVIPRLYSALIREKYGNDKSSLAKLRSPSIQAELIPTIAVGPIVDNVANAMQTFVNERVSKLEGFTDVQVKPKGFSDPEVLAKAQATRAANRKIAEETI